MRDNACAKQDNILKEKIGAKDSNKIIANLAKMNILVIFVKKDLLNFKECAFVQIHSLRII